MEDKNLISVIIVNYRSWTSLKDCLDSLMAVTDKNIVKEVVVIDNYSNDGQLELFRNNYTDVIFFENSGNNGFANGCNVGSKLASGSYLLFLNPDTKIGDGVLQTLVNVYKGAPDTGILSCLQINERGKFENQNKLFPSVSTFFGIFRSINRLMNKQINLKRFSNFENENFYPDWVSGSLVFIHRNWFDKLIGWNEDYWMYLEDIDLSKRISALGGKVVITRKATIFHAHGGASRINIKTKALTKTEVIISKHVYISNFMDSTDASILHTLMIVGSFLERFILALAGIVLFFNKKMRVHIYIFKHLITYYVNALFKGTWISPRSVNYMKK
ncbi:glycosyltransferase family 2 protein [Lutimonas sp.]|uniref:glycosyltransferase family 2 protein n=1 Tax=Lutimonas sp. TaxID=1872403 RepID=UPI003D9B800D